MKNIFKKINGAAVVGKETVGDFDFKNHYPDVNRSMAWAELFPYLRQAGGLFLEPFLGAALLDGITADEINGTGSPKRLLFLEKLRDAAAHHAIAYALPKKKTTVASMGAVENVATEGTTSSSQWGFRTTLWSVAQQADQLTDSLLSYLEKEIKSGSTEFNHWKNDAAYSLGATDFFRTTEDFQAFWNIARSRRTFIALLPFLRQQQREKIAVVVGQAQIDELLPFVKNGGGSTAQKKLIEMIRAALAPWAVFEATMGMSVMPDQDGFRVIGNADAIDNRAYSSDTTKTAILGIQQSAEKMARQNTAALRTFLFENEADFPTWKASSANPENEDAIRKGPICTGEGAVFI